MRKEAAKLGLLFSADDTAVRKMVEDRRSVEGHIHLDYGVPGNLMSRLGLDALLERLTNDQEVSHLFVPRRDRLARPDDPLVAVDMEFKIRCQGVTIITLEKVLPPFKAGERKDVMEIFSAVMEYDVSGRFRLQLAEKLIAAKFVLARQGFSIGGEPLYGFRRWLVDHTGAKKRELELNEHVKMAGHHVMWLPTAMDELKVVARIVEEIRTTPVGRIVRQLNAEGIPSPKAGRLRTVDRENNIRVPNSGEWTANTVKSIATHPLLTSVARYCFRSEGDQLRMTAQGARKLNASDYDGKKLISVRNPEADQILVPVRFEPLVKPESQQEIKEILEERGKHLKGKARTRNGVINHLGGRIFDMNCGWPLFRNAKRGEWCYSCGLYMNTNAQCCNHNLVRGEAATRFVLASIRQRLLGDTMLDKLHVRLRHLATSESDTDPVSAQRKNLEGELAKVQADKKVVGRNMAYAKDQEQYAAISSTFDKLGERVRGLEALLNDLPRERPRSDPEQEVDLALETLVRLSDLAASGTSDYANLAALLKDLNVRLFLKFASVKTGRRVRHVPNGGVLTFGSSQPPIMLYDGPTDRAIVRRRLAKGEPVIAGLGIVSPDVSNAGSDVSGSGNVKRVTMRCS
jgi:hypothetical protein